ncbi:MAG: hypothetical protein WD673_15915 [Alphaproteobacteria bacterium]
MSDLYILDDVQLLAAVGRVAVRHGQLDRVLRLTIKSVTAQGLRKALDSTKRTGSADLRKRVMAEARKKIRDADTKSRLERLLGQACELTERRNRLVHDVWVRDGAGNHVIIDDEHKRKPVPTPMRLDDLANAIHRVTVELNDARLNGFLAEALTRRQP